MSLATRPLHRRLKVLLMTGVGACLAVLVTQCRLVDDKVLGAGAGLPAAGSSESSTCITACKRAFLDSNKAETQLHVANVRACGEDATCLQEEEARYEAAKKLIKRVRTACIDACHNQGGGTAGR